VKKGFATALVIGSLVESRVTPEGSDTLMVDVAKRKLAANWAPCNPEPPGPNLPASGTRAASGRAFSKSPQYHIWSVRAVTAKFNKSQSN
jgi:hypothetical protein